MIKVKFGVKLNDWDQGQVWSVPQDFLTIKEAKFEVNNIINTMIKKMFKKVKYNKLIEIPKDYKAWYPDNTNEQILARLDGTVQDGEFYILVYQV